MKNIEQEFVLVTALPGRADIDCIAEAISLAFSTPVPQMVVLVHNEKKYTVDPREIVKDIGSNRKPNNPRPL